MDGHFGKWPAFEICFFACPLHALCIPSSHVLQALQPFVTHSCRQRIVTQSTGCENPLFFEEVYSYYARAEAWNVAPGAAAALQKLKEAGDALSILQGVLW